MDSCADRWKQISRNFCAAIWRRERGGGGGGGVQRLLGLGFRVLEAIGVVLGEPVCGGVLD